MSAPPDSLIKPINQYAEEVSNANGSNQAERSGIVCVLWRVVKLEVEDRHFSPLFLTKDMDHIWLQEESQILKMDTGVVVVKQ